MEAESIRQYCLEKKQVTEGFPFGDETLVFKVQGKIFLLLTLTGASLKFNAKCDPVHAVELRERYEAIEPGYHMNKKHWNTVTIDSSIPNKIIRELIDESYQLVVASLPKKDRDALL